MSRSSQLAKNTMILSIGTFLPKFVSIITLPVLTGYLTKEEYGTYDLITVMVSLLLPSVTLQIKAAAFRFLIDERENADRQKDIITNLLIFTLPVSAAALCVLFFVLHDVSPAIRIWICLYYLCDIVVGTIRQIARGLSYNLKYAISAIMSAIGKMLFAVILVWWFHSGLYGAVISLTGASLFSLAYLSISIKIWRYIDIAYLSKSTLKSLVGYSWPLVPNELSLWVMRLSDRIVVTSVMGLAANAVYAVANKIPSIINLAQGSLTLAWQENATIASKDNDAPQYYTHMFHVILRLQAGFFCLITGATPILFKLLIRGDYQDAYHQMPVLCFGIFYAGMATHLGGIYVAHKASKSVGITTVIAAIINLVTDLGTIRWIGLYAASGSTLISYLFLCIYRMIDVRKIVELTYNAKQILIMHVVMATVCVLFYFDGFAFKAINFILGTGLFLILNRDLLSAVLKRKRKKGSRRRYES